MFIKSYGGQLRLFSEGFLVFFLEIPSVPPLSDPPPHPHLWVIPNFAIPTEFFDPPMKVGGDDTMNTTLEKLF